MDEYIETEKQLKLQGNSWAVFVKSEAEQLDLKVGSNIGVILCRPEDRNYVHGLLCGSDPSDAIARMYRRIVREGDLRFLGSEHRSG